MTRFNPNAHPASRRSFRFDEIKLPLGLILALLTTTVGMLLWPALLTTPAGDRGILSFILSVFLFIVLAFSPRQGMIAVLLYLCLLGGVRRWLIPVFGWPDSDPMLLVGPAIVVVYAVNLAIQRLIPRDTQLARRLPWLLGLMVLEIFNPLQGGLMIGISGALFFIIPVLWYYIGRRIGTENLITRVFIAIIVVAILAALYGLYQTWFGFLESELEWFKLVSAHYSALDVGGTTRAFSFFTSSAEYGQFLGFGIVLIVAAILKGERRFVILLPLLGLAIFLTSERGLIVSVITICTVLWAIQGRTMVSWFPRGVLAAAIAIIGLIWSLHQAQNLNSGAQTQALIQHQTEGLLDPLNTQHSTAQVHTGMVLSGIVQGFTNPLGRGLGASNLAGTKYSDNTPSNITDNQGKDDPGNGSSEVDISNVFISLGFVGGLLYLSIQILVLKRAFQVWQSSRSQVALSLLAVLLVSLGQWTSLGHYAGFTLDWFCIGALDSLVLGHTQKGPVHGLEQADAYRSSGG